MTLQEKFDVISCKDCDMPFCDNKCTMLSDLELDKIEKIADDYAIEFAEWLTINYPNQRKFLLKQGNLMGFYSTKKLLEIYKKQRNL
jgi:hypothetical protein